MADSSMAIIERAGTCMLTYTLLYTYCRITYTCKYTQEIRRIQKKSALKHVTTVYRQLVGSISGPLLLKIQFLCRTVYCEKIDLCSYLCTHSMQFSEAL